MYKIFGILLAAMFSMSAWAQLPHEVLLLVNRQSQASKRVANTYAAARLIPLRNLVYLDIPESIYGGTATLTPEQFTQLIWEPASAAAKARGIDGQLLGGLTFVRNRIPGLSLVEDGKYLSKLFIGPNDRLKSSLMPLSLSTFKLGVGAAASVPEEVQYLKSGLGDDLPLPSMMLGYVGENGNDVQTVLDTIRCGVQSDFRGVHGGVYFIQSDDVRSKCREWQFYPAVNELKQRGIVATVTTNFPAGERNVMGVMMGAETVDPSTIGSFAPGAMAEHLTSWSAEFQQRQTKLTAWLKAGATASAGAVVEPYSNPNKFPSARFYVHYVSGCTMLESFYLSIACPLQTLLLGDPMARPYAPRIVLSILGADTMKDDFTYLAKADSRLTDLQYRYSFLLDDKIFQPMSENPSVWIPIKGVSDGYHELRAVASPRYPVDFGATAIKEIMVNRTGRSIRIDTQSIAKTGKYTDGIKVLLGGMQVPETVRLVSGSLVLDEQPYSEDMVLTLDEQVVGEGPVRIQVVAIYADGMEVASAPLGATIAIAP